MKAFLFFCVIVSLVNTAAAQDYLVEIRATHDGFDLPVVLRSSNRTVTPNKAIQGAKQVAPGTYQAAHQIFEIKRPLTGPSESVSGDGALICADAPPADPQQDMSTTFSS